MWMHQYYNCTMFTFCLKNKVRQEIDVDVSAYLRIGSYVADLNNYSGKYVLKLSSNPVYAWYTLNKHI